ncbi:MAG TPA: hypothetical protein VFJ50_03545, partial [Gemmatimonadales bacterium]|nr:hypothetical protein [Gemmatimonadales bacterium]
MTLSALFGCRGGDDASNAPVRTRVPVGLAPVVQDSMVETVRLTGRLGARPHGAADLMAPAAGVVRELRGQIGDRVARGAVLMLLDAPDLAADAAQKSAAAEQAAREARRQRQLLADGV